jgi:hypothetical protein
MEILFRGKRKDNGEGVEGGHVEVGVSYILPKGKTLNTDFVEIDPETRGMYTGLKDKNGKKIFGGIGEKGGDIVAIGKEIYIIKWSEATDGFAMLTKNGWFLTIKCLAEIEVIGTVADNPELLEG